MNLEQYVGYVKVRGLSCPDCASEDFQYTSRLMASEINSRRVNPAIRCDVCGAHYVRLGVGSGQTVMKRHRWERVR